MPTPQSGLLALLAELVVPGTTYYIALTSTLMTSALGLADVAAGEPTQTNYARLAVTFVTPTIDANGFAYTINNAASFNAAAGAIGPYQCIALVTAMSGTVGSVIAYYNLSNGLTTIGGGTTLPIEFPLELQTA